MIMNAEERKLLTKTLCEVLPYGIKGLHREEVHELFAIDCRDVRHACIQVDGYDAWFPIDTFKPYLRPMSSMTKDEAYEMFCTVVRKGRPIGVDIENDRVRFIVVDEDGVFAGHTVLFFKHIYSLDQLYWLLSHHFDYCGLIPMGLALEAKKGMYNADTEEEEVKVEIPNTLEEALAILDKIVSEEDMEWMKKRGAISVHLTLGMWIRNNWGLWENSGFYKYLHEKTGLTHPDDISNYIIEEFIKWKLGK